MTSMTWMTRSRLARAALCAGAALLLASCSTPGPQQYASALPQLDVQQYFNGRLLAHGMFQDRSGLVVKRFTVLMQCHWQGDTGTLDEDFTYADGSRQRRVWTLRKVAPDRYIGTAPDVVGEAVGVVSGNALRWNYVLALPVDGRIINVDFEDWMFLIDGRVMLNRAAMSKFGFNLGAVTLSFDKQEGSKPHEPQNN